MPPFKHRPDPSAGSITRQLHLHNLATVYAAAYAESTRDSILSLLNSSPDEQLPSLVAKVVQLLRPESTLTACHAFGRDPRPYVDMTPRSSSSPKPSSSSGYSSQASPLSQSLNTPSHSRSHSRQPSISGSVHASRPPSRQSTASKSLQTTLPRSSNVDIPRMTSRSSQTPQHDLPPMRDLPPMAPRRGTLASESEVVKLDQVDKPRNAYVDMDDPRNAYVDMSRDVPSHMSRI